LGNVPRFLVYRAGISISFWLPIWVIYYQQRGLSLIQIGILESATWMVSALAEIPTGRARRSFRTPAVSGKRRDAHGAGGVGRGRAWPGTLADLHCRLDPVADGVHIGQWRRQRLAVRLVGSRWARTALPPRARSGDGGTASDPGRHQPDWRVAGN